MWQGVKAAISVATPMHELNPDIPEWLDLIVEKLMAKEKSQRFASAGEVHELLAACLSQPRQNNRETSVCRTQTGIVNSDPKKIRLLSRNVNGLTAA